VLVGAINAAIHARGGSVESLNWANIALQVQGRTGKQCREKYKVGAGVGGGRAQGDTLALCGCGCGCVGGSSGARCHAR